MNAPLNKVDLLRARDGDHCWLCGERIDFAAKPNSSRAWSVEHLLPTCRGGPDTLENTVLCHPPCNRILGSRPLKDKIRLHERRRRKHWLSSLRSQWRSLIGGNPTVTDRV